MRRKLYNRHKRPSAGKLITGLLLGSVVGATVSWLRSPAGEDARRRLRGDRMSAQEKIKSAEGNVESHVRDLAAAVGEDPAFSRPHTTE